MGIFSLITGFILIFTGLIDLYYSIFHYEIYGPISMYLHKATWYCIRTIALRLPNQQKKSLFSHGAPLMIIVLLVFWLGIELFGFALVYYSGILRQNDIYSILPKRRFSDALYMSGITLPTLGFGDVVPVGMFYRMTAVIEALIGFAIMTLSLTFVLNIYSVIQQFRGLASSLHNETGGSGRVWEIIQRQKHNNEFFLDIPYIRHLDRTLVDWYESLHQFPVAYYFYSPRNYLSIPYTFRIIGEFIGIVRFGLPSNHEIPNTLSVFSLHQEFLSIIENITTKYLSRFKRYTQSPLSYQEFRHNLTGIKKKDIHVLQFIQLNNRMRKLCNIHQPQEPHELYVRYTKWLTFSSAVTGFVVNTTLDHGYSPEEIFPVPERRYH